ncbi:MAG: hypothetical protein JNM82_08960 [Rhodocyclaceae bacterium]|nr:hypothetical protein [Rhodocyclaceae bacterium]
MTRTRSEIPVDRLAGLAPAADQRKAAHSAQDAFGRVFRLSFEGGDAERRAGLRAVEDALAGWAAEGGDESVRALRLAMLIAGLDQWGLAYSQAFGLAAIPGLTELMGQLRPGLEPRREARVQRQFAAIDACETDALEFKMTLRRGIHLALWHAMVASAEKDEAERIGAALAAMLVAVARNYPEVGWRFVADTLAHVQVRCLADGLAAHGLARECNQGLFEALDQSLPKEMRDRIGAHATEAVMAWQRQARNAG